MKILFLCVENAGRSQMAEAFALKIAPPGTEIFSAGSHPVLQVHPAVAEAMREAGIEIGNRVPKGLEKLPEGVFDLVVGMGCGDACPAARARKTVSWDIPDPRGQPAREVRRIRDQIDLRVRRLMAGLRPVRLRRWPTALSGIILFLGIAFIVSTSLFLSPALSVPYPEKGLARVTGRALQLREALGQVAPWERTVHAFWDPSLGTSEELAQMTQWHREIVSLAKDPEILPSLPGVMTHAGIMEGESGQLDLLQKRTRNWLARGPALVPLYATLLRAAYFEEPPPAHWPGLLHELLPPGWFRDRLEERLYRKIGETARADAIRRADRQAARRLLWRYRFLTGLDLAVFLLFGAATFIFLKFPLEFWKVGPASLPPPWPVPAGMALLARGCALGVAISSAFAFLPAGSHPAGMLFSYLLWTLPVVWLFHQVLLRPNGLSLGQELGLSVQAKEGWKLALLCLLGLGLDSLGGWLIGSAGWALDRKSVV